MAPRPRLWVRLSRPRGDRRPTRLPSRRAWRGRYASQRPMSIGPWPRPGTLSTTETMTNSLGPFDSLSASGPTLSRESHVSARRSRGERCSALSGP
eukprot:5775524-Alexandrium_andersonii.AAC.1